MKRQGKSSIPALTLWVSPLSIYMVLLNSWASTAKNKLDRTVEVVKTSLSDAYVVSTDQLVSSESVNVISETEQDIRAWLFAQFDEREVDYRNRLWKDTDLALAPDSWCLRYCAQPFNVSEYLKRARRELKNVKGILAKPAQKQGKVISQNTIDLVLSMYKDDEFSRQQPGKKDYVSIAKGVHKQNTLFYAT